MSPFRLFREWKTRREVRAGIRSYDESRDRPAGPSFLGIIDEIPPKDGRVRVRVLEDEAQLVGEDEPLYWPEGGEPHRIPPFPDAWRCRTCRWWGKTTFSPA